jgi:thiol-disulfide isomerase/thioredoxin
MIAGLIAGIIGLSGVANAQDTNTTLKVGDAAPSLAPSQWLQGDPVKSFETGKVYIVEFWATWCGPCRASIPHVNELYKKLKDKGLVVIGQNVWERKSVEDVTKFVKDMGDKMTYPVAFDGENRMAKTWMEAAGQEGVPTAFLVDKDGKIAWIGHPMDGLDKVAEEALAGSFNPAKEAERKEAQQAQLKVMGAHAQKLGEAMLAEKWDDALAEVAEMQKVAPAEAKDGIAVLKFGIYTSKKDGKAAADLARQISESTPDNPELLNILAWELATAEGLQPRDMDLALALAMRANKAAEEKDPGVLDTLARITFMKGDAKQAIELQKKALGLATEQPIKDDMAKTLKSYEAGTLPKPAPEGEGGAQ